MKKVKISPLKLLKQADKEDLAAQIEVFSSLMETNKNHRALSKRGLIKTILEEYSINNKSINVISDEYGISTSMIHKLLQDFYLYYFNDEKIQELSFFDAKSHLGVLYSFFNSVVALSKEISFNAIFSRKIREKIAEILSQEGLEKTLENRKLMNAWRESVRRNEILLKLAIEQTNTYLNLIEKVLDRQREVAFVKAIYDVLAELDPQTALKLQERLYEDEYARALLEATSLEDFISLVINTKKSIKELSKTHENILDVEYEER